jgi:ABC-type nitrate/sulfonate/bicarbonate transport system substrate-binding protein
VVIVLALTGVDANAQTSVTFGFTAGGDALPVFVAKEEGLFEKAGLRVELQRLANTALGVPALASQSIQLSQLTAPVFLQAREAGLDLVATSGLTLYGDDITAGAVTLPDSPVKRAADFSGKTVAVAGLRGTTQVLFTKWLMQQNVDPKSVKFVEATFSLMLDLLKSRKVDAALLGGPIFSRVCPQRHGASRRPGFPGDGAGTDPQPGRRYQAMVRRQQDGARGVSQEHGRGRADCAARPRKGSQLSGQVSSPDAGHRERGRPAESAF